MKLEAERDAYAFTFQPNKVVESGLEAACGIVPQIDEDRRLVRLVVLGPTTSSLLVTDVGDLTSDQTVIPRIELDASHSSMSLVLPNGPHSQEEPLRVIDEGVWLRLDPYDQPLRIVFEKVPFDDNGAIDLEIHWTTVGISEDMMSA